MSESRNCRNGWQILHQKSRLLFSSKGKLCSIWRCIVFYLQGSPCNWGSASTATIHYTSNTILSLGSLYQLSGASSSACRCIWKITTRLQSVGTPTPTIVPVSHCLKYPSVLVSQCPGVPMSWCPSVLWTQLLTNRVGMDETHKQGVGTEKQTNHATEGWDSCDLRHVATEVHIEVLPT